MYDLNDKVVVAGLDGTTAVSPEGLSKGTRAQFLAFAQTNSVPEKIKTGLADNSLLLTDRTIYAIAEVGGTNVKMFLQADNAAPGIRNISNGKLPQGETLLVSEITVLAAATYKDGAVNANDESLAKTAKYYPIDKRFPTFSVIGRTAAGAITVVEEAETTALATQVGAVVDLEGDDIFGGLETGSYNFSVGRKKLIIDSPLTKHKENKNSHLSPGTIKLDNPRFIEDNQLIEFEFELGEAPDTDGTNTAVWLFVALSGTGTIPA